MIADQQPAGWYPDQHGIVRWWDGAQWTQHTAPAATTTTRTNPPRNGLGIAALIIGIIGCLFGFVPFTFWIAGPMGVTALVLGLAGRGRVKRGEASNRITTWAGIVVGLGSLALSIWGAAVLFGAFDEAVSEMEDAGSAPAVEDGDAAPANAGVDGEAETRGDGDPEADGDAEAGTRENPYPAGSTADLGDWHVSADASLPDGSAAVAEANEFNPPPQDGHEYVVVPVTVTYNGDSTGTAWLDLTVEFVSADGNTYDGFCGLMLDGLMHQGEQFPDATVDASACAEVPADQTDGGVWRITESLTLDQSTAFFAME